MDQAGGFREQPHTADWALLVWAPDLAGLLQQAARGMYDLMHARVRPEAQAIYQFEIAAADPETLLVMFLSELLYFTQRDEVGFEEFEVSLAGNRVTAKVTGAPLEAIAKEIKAVTYHNLSIHPSPRGLEVRIVFDV